MMNEILFEASKIISYVTWVCTMVSFGLSLNGIFNKKSKMTKKVIVIWTTIGSFTFIAGLIIFLYGSSLIKVPDVVGKIYKDAKNILVEYGLDFNTESGKEDFLVINQSPKGTMVVMKGTKVELELEEREPSTPTPTNTPTPTITPTPTDTPSPTPPVHVWKLMSSQKATCVSTGVEYYECDCGEKRIEVLPISSENHNEIPIYGYGATCTKTGLTDGKQCALCGKTTKEQETIGITEHHYEDDGKKKYCRECGYVVATWELVEDWTPSVLTEGVDEKVVSRKETVTKYRYYSCMFWSNNRLDIVSASEVNAKQYATWNGIWLSNTSWREIGESVCTGVFAAGKQGTSNGTYVKVATGYYDSPQNPMPNCIGDSPCFDEEIIKEDVMYYQKWRLVYKDQ